ncbi:MAG: metal ABC transporter permease [Verrucomicrobiota bacterium]|nr:metal ABC transporter permease [Verrucomicrobiota bacterium]MDP7291233.1 metal ABC transporter permease [Verrucomicrobiota bacterium]
MTDFIPPFEWQRVLVEPWTENLSTTFWIVLMGFLITAACGLIGNYLILRRMALVGDAISHSVLPGMAIAFLLADSLSTLPMFLGALGAGIVTTVLIELIHKKTRVKQDSAIGITFSTLFAIGVIIISVGLSDSVHLDTECVLYGEIAFVPLDLVQTKLGSDALSVVEKIPGLNSEMFLDGDLLTIAPPSVIRMAVVAGITLLLVVLFYKELLVTSFDSGLSSSLGINSTVVHYVLMGMLSVIIVSAFEAVGAILVIAMLILPGATASLLAHRLPLMFGITVVHALLSAVGGIHLATWLDCSPAGAMVVAGSAVFALAWVFSPSEGLLRRWLGRELDELDEEELERLAKGV